MPDKQINILPMTGSHVSDVARLHAAGIKEGFISSLGHEFTCCLYQAITEFKNAFGFVAVMDDNVVGFVSFAESTGSLYKFILRKNFFKLFWKFLPKALNIKNIKSALETLLYPVRRQSDLPEPELLAIVVDQQARGLNAGKRLVEAGNAECRRRGINRYKVIVYELFESNEFYKRVGFKLVGRQALHGKKDVHNIYVMDLA